MKKLEQGVWVRHAGADEWLSNNSYGKCVKLSSEVYSRKIFPHEPTEVPRPSAKIAGPDFPSPASSAVPQGDSLREVIMTEIIIWI